MKKILLLMLLFGTIGCSLQLSQEFYKTPTDIQFQQFCCYMPKGYTAGLASPNYQGVIAIVGNDLIFDAQGVGSRPWMTIIKPFIISKNQISDVKISKELALGRKLITINTQLVSYDFFLANADQIFKNIKTWLEQKEE